VFYWFILLLFIVFLAKKIWSDLICNTSWSYVGNFCTNTINSGMQFGVARVHNFDCPCFVLSSETSCHRSSALAAVRTKCFLYSSLFIIHKISKKNDDDRRYSGRSEDTCVCSTIPINFFRRSHWGGGAKPSAPPPLRTPLIKFNYRAYFTVNSVMQIKI